MRAAILALEAIESARIRAVALPAPARIPALQRLAEAAAMLETTADDITAGRITADVRLRIGQVIRMTDAIGRKDLRC